MIEEQIITCSLNPEPYTLNPRHALTAQSEQSSLSDELGHRRFAQRRSRRIRNPSLQPQFRLPRARTTAQIRGGQSRIMRTCTRIEDLHQPQSPNASTLTGKPNSPPPPPPPPATSLAKLTPIRSRLLKPRILEAEPETSPPIFYFLFNYTYIYMCV